jgi:hypothetical protein
MCHGKKGSFSRSAQLSIASQCMGQDCVPCIPLTAFFLRV